MELRQRGDRLPAQPLEALGMHEPVAIDGHDPATRLQGVEQTAQPLGAEGHAAGQRRQPHAAAAGVADVLLDAPPPGSSSRSSSRCATSAGALRLKRGGAMSSRVPPPIVTIGE